MHVTGVADGVFQFVSSYAVALVPGGDTIRARPDLLRQVKKEVSVSEAPT